MTFKPAKPYNLRRQRLLMAAILGMFALSVAIGLHPWILICACLFGWLG